MPSAWITHVKNYAKQHGIEYGEALKKASSTFKKGTHAPMMGKSKKRMGKSMKNKSRKNRRSRRRR
jgi:hypothetical protein